MSNFEVWEQDLSIGTVTRVRWHDRNQSQDVPRYMLEPMQILSVEGVKLERVIVGNKWQAVIYARVQSPPLVMRLTGQGKGMKELTEGLRLRAFLARLAMEGETKELVDELLDDIWHERDFASNTNAEIADGTEAEG